MVKHLHKYLNLDQDDVLILKMNVPAHVSLMDDANYQCYLNEEEYEYYGDLVKKTPFRLGAPQPGNWHLVIEQENPRMALDVSVSVVKNRRMR